MLAPSDTPTNSTTPGSSSGGPMPSRSPLRAPQEANYYIDDHSRASELQAAAPQYIDDGYSVPSTHSVGSPYSQTSSVHHPQVESLKNSPSVSHPQAYSPSASYPQAYSPALASPSLTSNYVPPPSPTPSHHSQAYPVPHAHNNSYPTVDSAYQQQQYAYPQDLYQQGYQQQPYPEPTLHTYPAYDASSSSVTKPVNNGRRKKIIWIGSIVILILIGAIVGLVVAMKNKDSDNSNSNNSNNSSSGNSPTRTSSTPTTTTKPPSPISSIPVTLPSSPTTTTTAVSSIPVIVPTPGPSTGNGNGSRVEPIPLPDLPPKGDCAFSFCGDYFGKCNGLCAEDGEYKSCLKTAMLAPQDSPISSNTPGSSSDALVLPHSISRAPQDPNHNIDNSSRASALMVSSPQYIDGYSDPATHTADSPYRTSSVRHPHAQSVEKSPSVNHPHAYSPTLASPRVSLNYIPPPSPTPSQSSAYPVPEGLYGKIAYPTDEGAYHQQQYQNIYQDPYQRSYQQPYPEPAFHAYPEPTLVDTCDEKIGQTSGTKPGNDRRKRIIWIGTVVILALIGAIVALVVTMKNKDSGSNANINSNLGNNTTTSTLRPTLSASRAS
ncbi:hypothetical protein BGZ95_011237, partial [Linnemannia exigua]